MFKSKYSAHGLLIPNLKCRNVNVGRLHEWQPVEPDVCTIGADPEDGSKGIIDWLINDLFNDWLTRTNVLSDNSASV